MRSLALLTMLACGDRTSPERAVVAEVDGVPILESQLERVMRSERLPARQALDRLIDDAIWAGAARRSGSDLGWERKRALVQRLLEREVERPVRAEDVTEEEIVALHGKARTLEADHLLVRRPGEAQDRARARAFADRIHAAALHTTDRDAFVALATSLSEPGLEVVHEDLGSFRRDGTFVAAFEERAFRMSSVGEISPAFETDFGWHVVRLRAVGNWFGGGLEETRAKVLEQILTTRRRQRLEALHRDLARRAHVEIDPAPLRALQSP